MTEEQRNMLRKQFDENFAISTEKFEGDISKQFAVAYNDSMFKMMLLGAIFAMENFNDKIEWHDIEDLPERPNELSRFSNRVLTIDSDGDHDICIYNFEDKEWRNTDGYLMDILEQWAELPVPKNL